LSRFSATGGACQLARKHIEHGAVTAGYSAGRVEVLQRLNAALAKEIVCVLRYRRHFFMARGIHAKSVSDEFLAHSNEEQGYADQVAARRVQLGGEPGFAPNGLSQCSHSENIAGDSLANMIIEDLVAERIAFDSYRALIEHLTYQAPTTSQMLKGILAVEEQHADELADLLEELPS
jgi:bacterioferritin